MRWIIECTLLEGGATLDDKGGRVSRDIRVLVGCVIWVNALTGSGENYCLPVASLLPAPFPFRGFPFPFFATYPSLTHFHTRHFAQQVPHTLLHPNPTSTSFENSRRNV